MTTTIPTFLNPNSPTLFFPQQPAGVKLSLFFQRGKRERRDHPIGICVYCNLSAWHLVFCRWSGGRYWKGVLYE
ncbi:hypothetical protein JTE90_024418 [Oedothorax gibbosus]|uniref:Uncharacterized protein n=1 Tax=Oedothorax gibbosus TaxID=931172 RepID=A0AAV6UG13_9ARAC|nr:hypothetical protein JTE90_024418 [Oedothorax gibbosus]